MEPETIQRLMGENKPDKRAVAAEFIRSAMAFDDAEKRYMDAHKQLSNLVDITELPLVVFVNGKVFTIDENFLPMEATYIAE